MSAEHSEFNVERSGVAGRAVFLSYASQDAEAARRICDALRAAGVEVWFDQSELRGGDAWDAKIRKQIKECALFVPVISANTQARREGYFRIEWKLATQRTHAIAEGTPFLLPLVLDKTLEPDALVPSEFREVQWTRLSGADALAAFVARVGKLLAPEVEKPAPHVTDREILTGAKRAKARRWRGWAIGAVAAIAGAAVLVLRYPKKPALPGPEPMRTEMQASAPERPWAAPRDKSIAVLPFENRSTDKDNAFFADGVHDVLLANLTTIGELRVISTDSVEPYRQSQKSLREIAQELHVTWILKGSVQRAGPKIRVLSTLIRAESGEQVWAQPFDRDLNDIFALQSELAQAIATALKATLSPQEEKLIKRAPTTNLAAYDLFLRAQAERRGENRAFAEREKWLQQAITLDPAFASAWADLASIHSLQHLVYPSRRLTDGRMEKARTAIEQAIKLAPDAPDVRLSLGYYHYGVYRDYARALQVFEALAQEQPNAWAPRYGMGNVQRRQGRWVESLANFNRAHELDPANIDILRQIDEIAQAGRRFDAAIAAERKLLALSPNKPREMHALALQAFASRGSTREMDEFLAGLGSDAPALSYRLNWALLRGDFDEIRRLDTGNRILNSYYAVVTMKGDVAAAAARLRERAAAARNTLMREPEDNSSWQILAEAEAMLNHREEALRCARKAMELVPESLDAKDGARARATFAFVCSWVGDKDAAVAEYARLLRTPYSGLNVHEMRKNPRFWPLLGDSRFEALLDDPKSNAPLF